jgi:hypothetical protein
MRASSRRRKVANGSGSRHPANGWSSALVFLIDQSEIVQRIEHEVRA